MSSPVDLRVPHRALPAVVPPLVDAVPKRPPHFLPVPRDAAGNPWPTELDVRSALPPPEPLFALLEALAVVPRGTPQYLRFRGSPTALVGGLAQRGIESAAEPMADGSWRLRAVVPVEPVDRPPPAAPVRRRRVAIGTGHR